MSNLLSNYSTIELTDLIGNVEARLYIDTWLNNFRSNCINQPQIIFMYGPCGIGKTTFAQLLFQKYGYHVKRMNSGDIRSKKRVGEFITNMKDNTLQIQNNTFVIEKLQTAIIMDDIDGMTCGDKGGLHELLQIINVNYDIPIICISNKKIEKKYKSICLIEFQYPSFDETLLFAQKVCQSHNIQYHIDSLKYVVSDSQFNIRKLLNLIMQISSFNKQITQEITSKYEIQLHNNTQNNIFQITQNILTHSNTIATINQLYHYDMLIPDMLHDNLKNILNYKKINKTQYFELYSLLLKQLIYHDNGCEKNKYNKVIYYSNNISALSSYICCYAFSNILCLYQNRKLKTPLNISFTNVLSKQATYTYSLAIYTSIAKKLNISIQYFYLIFPLIFHDIIHSNKIHHFFLKLSIDEIEKCIIIYTKWYKNQPKMKVNYKKCLDNRIIV